MLPVAFAQQNSPHIGYVYPAGGQQGTGFQVTIGGQFLNGVTNVFLTGTGVTASIVVFEKQLTPKEQDEYKEKLHKLQDKKKSETKLTADEEKTLAEVIRKLTMFGRRLTNRALSEFVTLKCSVAANAEPGKREVRLGTQFGLSNPMAFCVGTLPEVTKPDWKNVPKSRSSMDPVMNPHAETNATLPCVLNGQIQPGGVDRYRFRGHAGQQLVISTSARELIPYIADAVPGWFQAALTLSDAAGKELVYDDNYRFHPDPVLFYKIPKEGDYVLEIKDSLYRGREDFIYRITIGELPFVTAVFPLGAPAGSRASVALWGWNLPIHKVNLDLHNETPGTYPLTVHNGPHTSNQIPFAIGDLPECLETKPNNTITNAQVVNLPIIINGRIDRPGDWGVFRFDGHAGDQIVAEVYARRLDSPLDSVLYLLDATGKQLAFNDDYEDKGTGLNTHHADSYLMATLSSNGSYFVRIGDAQHNGGLAYAYRLRLSAPRPDFELRVTPSSLNLRTGTSVPLTVFALRRDGFAGAIALTLTNAPSGFKLTAAKVPAGQDQLKLTLSAPSSPVAEPVSLHIEGRATIAGQPVVHAAVPAEDMLQAFAYRHLVPSESLQVAVLGRYRPEAVAARIVSSVPVKIPAGGSARVQVSMPVGPMITKFAFELDGAPEGISIVQSSPTEIVLHADAAKIKPGLTGNLIAKAFGERAVETGKEKKPANPRRLPLGALPAIPFEIVSQ